MVRSGGWLATAVCSAASACSALSRGGAGLLPEWCGGSRRNRLQQFAWRQTASPGEQFVEQDPQAVDVAARINVQPAQFGLLRAHIGRRADELLEGGENRLVGQRLPAVALAMPKSMILGTAPRHGWPPGCSRA